MRIPIEKWSISGYNRAEAVELCRRGVNPLVALLLASRGMTDTADLDELLKCGTEDISDPFLLRDMDLAAERVKLAIERGEHVAVYGDYDVDGITASCLVTDYLRSRGLECDVYIPERLEEGYGVNESALDTIRASGVSLIITVDCGVTAADKKKYAEALGMDMVITDHHEVSGELPEAPVVDPKRPDCPSPAKGLAGVGVAFKLVCAVDGVENTEALLDKYADLVAVGTIADVMPVTGENRVYIRRGLELLRRGTHPGLHELCVASGVEGRRVSVQGVGYTLAPRINAAGRVGSANTAVELLLTRDWEKAAALSDKLCDLNRERQRVEGEMLDEAVRLLGINPPEGKPIVLASDTWHQGVAGIVASRVSEKYGLPAVIICVKDGVGRGSCRSATGFNVFAALQSCRDILQSFGGHEMAAGITINAENVDALRQALGEYYTANPPETEGYVLNVDFEIIKPEILTIANIEAMERMEPFGNGNPQPMLCMKGVSVESVIPLSEGKHTKMWLKKDDMIMEAVCFGKSAEKLKARKGVRANVAFLPQINEFRGRSNVQLLLYDFKVLE